MGICLDTEQSDGSQAFEEGVESWTQNSPRFNRNAVTPSAGKFPMHNDAHVQFEAPKAPVIFVLGGPGSGKVTHCDTLMQEKKEVVHINMSDLLQQYAIGNDIPDYGQLSSRTVTEVLMVEMKMAPNAKTYLISGYPRNMRDVVEYSEKIQVVNGVILISWRQKVLERQIDYGAKLGQVVLSLAKMELNNFYKNVIPVAQYFDQSNMLISIHGERPPADVYKDFKEAIFQILGDQDNPPEFTNGGPLSVTSIGTELPTVQTNHQTTGPINSQRETVSSPDRPKTQVISVGHNSVPNFNSPVKPLTYPPVLWVIGGPGSNKAALCSSAAKDNGWTHISLGKLLRAQAESSQPLSRKEITKLKECISNGDLVPSETVMKHVDTIMESNADAKGIILDGFPRDMDQALEFENKFKQKPTIILLDCSKLQLGKGRLDDSVTAFRRRLEIFRQSSLPMLKAMDNIGRLTIVDGDTDSAPVQEDFKNVVKEHMEYMLANIQQTQPTAQLESSHQQLNGHLPTTTNGHIPNGHMSNGHLSNGDATLQDLEAPAVIDTISKRVGNGVSNGISHMANGKVANHMVNGITNLAKGVAQMSNGHARPPMLAAASRVPVFSSLENGGHSEVRYMDSHI
ncbi:adenylate kinase isoenzyme 5 [Anthonomus grandis grandis]|uniref:adenylate kinase isoenzyme 5 n=1 Tax=Anthonomus grandis grandis TaxID=2921223 RepID=UPI002166723E|nr:adenylate kinase isoenzyme 5 [Anthonomus grandis grandis]